MDRRSGWWIWYAVALVGAAVAVGLAGHRTPSAAGSLVTIGLPLVRIAADLSAALAVGGLLGAAFLLPPGRTGVVSRAGRAELRRSGIAAAAWAVLALVEALFNLADTLGVPFSGLFRRGVIGTYLWALPAGKAFVWVAALAAFVAVANLLTTSTGLAATWLLPCAIALGLPVVAGHGSSHAFHSLALTGGLVHVWAATGWLGLALVTADQLRRGVDGAEPAAAALNRALPWLAVVVAASGAASAFTRLASPGQLLTTGYGRLVLLLVALLLAAAHGVRRLAARRLLAGQALLLAAAFGVAGLLAGTPYPRPPATFPSPAEDLLGRTFPAQPTAARILFGWAPDPFWLTIVVVSLAVYFAGVRRLHRRGDPWPPLRSVAWLAGCAALLWATCGGVAGYAPVSFSLHMLQHMSMSMVVPILLTLGAPVTLALRAIHAHHGARRGPREWIVWALHTPVSRFISHPIYVLAVYTVGLYGVYFTPLFNLLMHSHLGHVLMLIHFLAAGLLFYWVVIGVDPGPRRVPHWARLLLVMLTLVIHAFFALAIMMATHPMVSDWYVLVRPPWLTDVVHDQYVGGGIAWAFGEVPTLLVLIALAVQWSRSDDRDAARHDRQAERDGDADLNAYNEQLARLSHHDRG